MQRSCGCIMNKIQPCVQLFRQRIHHIESWNITAAQAIVTFLIIVWIRNTLEKLLEEHHVLALQLNVHDWIIDLIHVMASWASIFILISIGLSLFSGRNLMRTNRIVLAIFPLIWLPPLWDICMGSSGDIVYQYDFQHFASSFIGLFNPAVVVPYVTPGVRVEMAIAMLLSVAYILAVSERQLGQRFVASLLGGFWIYVSIFMVGFLPAIWFALLGSSSAELLGLSVLGVESALSNLLWYLPVMLCVTPLWFKRSSPKLWQALLCSLRPSRILIYLAICNLAFLSACNIGLVGWDWLNPYDMGVVTLLNLALTFAFVSMTVLNDICDAEIDAVSNQERPLIKGLISRDEFVLLGLICGALSLLLSFAVNAVTAILMLTILSLGTLYSAPPLRLRRYIGVGHFVLAMIAATVYLYGATPVLGNMVFQQINQHQWFALVVLFFIGVHFKDIKDIDGDKSAGISTLSTLLGSETAYQIVGAAMIVAILGLVAMGYLANSIFTWGGLLIFSVGWHVLHDGEKVFWVLLTALGVVFLPAI